MEFIFEVIAEILFQGIFDASKNNKISKFIRYPLIALVIIFFGGVIFLMIFLGVKLWNKNIAGSVLLLAIGLFMFVTGIKSFRKEYIKKEKDI